MRKLGPTVLVVIAVGGVFAYVQGAARDYDQTVKKHFNVQKGGTLYLDSDRGSVEIRSHASNEVDVVVRLTADTRSRDRAEELFDRFELSFDQRRGDVEVLGKWRGRWGGRNQLRIHFDIRVPEEYNLDIQTACWEHFGGRPDWRR